jgi:hypothetical protein
MNRSVSAQARRSIGVESGRLTAVAAGVALALSLAVTRPAHADAYSEGTAVWELPGVSCTGGSVWASERGNWGSSSVVIQCPLLLSSFGNGGLSWNATNVWVHVNHGWATTSSCNVHAAAGWNSWWVFPTSSVQSGSNYDTVVLTLPNQYYAEVGEEVECGVPSGGDVILDYSVQTTVFFPSWATYD